jgi:septum formation protein
MMNIILASSSPRRLRLLSNFGFDIHLRIPDVDETPLENENASDMVIRLAKLKANALILPEKMKNWPIIAADTIVCCETQVLGKPQDKQDAVRILTFLSGKKQEVITGYALKKGIQEITGMVSTTIVFRNLSEIEIQHYVETEEPMDKAGAYGIQGHGASLLKTIHGSYSNVIGLPVDEVLMSLKSLQ